MKIKLLAALIVAGTAMSAQFAHATDGLINFKGLITPQTCTINGNGSGSSDFTVTLPTVSVGTLNQAGASAGRTPFKIALTNCTPESGTVHTFFEAGPTTDAATGNLILDAGGASNVQIRLLNDNFTYIKAGFADASQQFKTFSISGGNATLSYYAEYVATAAATPGEANSRVMYTIAYQ
ncbi:fimbrial protein [Cupriavidus necator]|uniref:fimbrial protein n=1 Tax=Cupriavidus necator TaxID=106590 RepID=UPI00339D624D